MHRNGLTKLSEKIKGRARKKFFADLSFSLDNTAIKTGIYHTAVQRILKDDSKLSPYKLQMNQESNVEDRIKRIYFALYCLNEL